MMKTMQRNLSQLQDGASAQVLAVDPAQRMGERLLDLGFTPGARVERLFTGLAGDPAAYLVRDTVIALRAQDAALVEVQ